MWIPLKKEHSWKEGHTLTGQRLKPEAAASSCGWSFSCALPLLQSTNIFFSPLFLVFLTHTCFISSPDLSKSQPHISDSVTHLSSHECSTSTSNAIELNRTHFLPPPTNLLSAHSHNRPKLNIFPLSFSHSSLSPSPINCPVYASNISWIPSPPPQLRSSFPKKISYNLSLLIQWFLSWFNSSSELLDNVSYNPTLILRTQKTSIS